MTTNSQLRTALQVQLDFQLDSQNGQLEQLWQPTAHIKRKGGGDDDDDGDTRLAFQIVFIDKMVTQLLLTPQSNILSGVSCHITNLHMHFPSPNSSTYATIKGKTYYI